MASEEFDDFIIKYSSSWSCVNPEIAGELEALRLAKGEFNCDGNYSVLWHTRHKFVLLLELPSGKQVVYKAPLKVKGVWKYLLRPGAYGMEALNFIRLSRLGLPLVKLLGAGEIRNFFILKSGFLITEFASRFADGRVFMSDDLSADQLKYKDEFICRNLKYLAVMHNNGYIHKGFTPFNLLWSAKDKPDENGNILDLKWIDVASCRKVFFRRALLKGAVRDLALFFHYMPVDEESLLSYLEHYISACRNFSLSSRELLTLIRKNPVR